MKSDKPIVITREIRPAFSQKWRVTQGEGNELNHSTGHHNIEGALLMAKILMQGIEENE